MKQSLAISPKIIAFICRKFKISEADFYSRRQSVPPHGRVLPLARHTACWLMREASKKSYSEIGRIVYRGDHTMGIYAVKSIEKKRSNDVDFVYFTGSLLMEYKEENGESINAT